MKIDWKKLVAAILICQLAGIIGSIFSAAAIPEWYFYLVKPAFTPPNWLFAPVWIVLYTLMGIATYLVYEKGVKKKKVKQTLKIFGGQLVLNALWSVLFFGLRNPFYALICILILWLAIMWTMFRFYEVDRKAGYMLIPYIWWVSFASYLNFEIWMLNG
ncbi:MAG: TspO/MBR family protein [Candidatus Micrarchaeota archaeon]